VKKFIKLGVQKIDKNLVIQAIKSKIYVENILFNHFSPYLNSSLKPLIVLVFRTYWDLIEFYLTEPENLRKLIVETHPELKDILYSKEGIEWLNENCKRSYKKIYFYTWS